jgi:hypothetical protein
MNDCGIAKMAMLFLFHLSFLSPLTVSHSSYSNLIKSRTRFLRALRFFCSAWKHAFFLASVRAGLAVTRAATVAFTSALRVAQRVQWQYSSGGVQRYVSWRLSGVEDKSW